MSVLGFFSLETISSSFLCFLIFINIWDDVFLALQVKLEGAVTTWQRALIQLHPDLRVAFPNAVYKGHPVTLSETSCKAAKEEGGWHCLILLLVNGAKFNHAEAESDTQNMFCLLGTYFFLLN